MIRNCLLKEPFIINKYKQLSGTLTKTYVVLSNAPDKIIETVKLYNKTKNKKYIPILENFYGKKWEIRLGHKERELLNKTNSYLECKSTYVGGKIENDEIDNLIDIALPEENVNNDEFKITFDDNDISNYKDDIIKNKGTLPNDEFLQNEIDENNIKYVDEIEYSIEYVTNVDIFQEDSIFTLKEKIFIIMNIPIYRQHLFYINLNISKIPYTIKLDGKTQFIDIRHLIENTKHENNNCIGNNNFIEKMHGVPIDKQFYLSKNDIKILSYDQFQLIDNSLCTFRVYVADMNEIINENNMYFKEIRNDNYQFENIYYGFVCKYYPMITKDVFHVYLSGEKRVWETYNYLAIPTNTLLKVFNKQKKIIYYNYNKYDSEKIKKLNKEIKLSVTSILGSAIIYKLLDNEIFNLRILFDNISTSKTLPMIILNISDKKIKKTYLEFSLQPSYDKISIPSIFHKYNDEAIYFLLNNNYGNLINEYIWVSLDTYGNFYVHGEWLLEDKMNFNKVIDNLIEVVNPFIDHINPKLHLSSKVGTTSILMLEKIIKETFIYKKISLSIIYSKNISKLNFKIIQNYINEMVDANLVVLKDIQVPNSIDFRFIKGVYSTETKYTVRGAEISNEYIYLSDENYNKIWKYLFNGKKCSILHRSTDVIFNIINFDNDEFQRLYNYILCMIMRFEESVSNITDTPTNTRKLKKLVELDPNLFYLQKYDYTKIYSKICQSNNQPSIFTDDEYNKMSINEKNGIVKYWNFTSNKPAYYKCENKKYPLLGFKIGVHPLNYCLPCCIKKISYDNKSKINECLKNYIAESADKINNDFRYIVQYDKKLLPGRIQHISKEITSVLCLVKCRKILIYGINIKYDKLENISFLNLIIETINMNPNDISEYQLSKFINTEIKYTIKSFVTLIINTIKNLNKNLQNIYFQNLPHNDLFITISNFILNLERIFINNNSTIYDNIYDWNNIFIYLIKTFFNINIIIFEDNSFNTNIKVDETCFYSIENDVNNLYLLILQKNNKYYPIYSYTDSTSGEILQYNFVKLSRTNKLARTFFTNSDPELKFIFEFIFKYYHTPPKIFSYKNVLKILNEMKYKILFKFINKKNHAYAFLAQNESYIYIEFDEIININDGFNENYSILDTHKYNIPVENITKFINKLRKLTDTNIDLVPVKYNNNDQYIGYFYDNKFMWCNKFVDIFSSSIYNFNYHPYIINYILNKIYYINNNIHNDGLKYIKYNMYKSNSYLLYIVEILNYFKYRMNIEVRNQIFKIMEIKSFNEIQYKLKDLILGLSNSNSVDLYDRDFKKILTMAYNLKQQTITIDTFKKMINGNMYIFDKFNLLDLIKLPREDIEKVIKHITYTNIIKTSESNIAKHINNSNKEFPNILINCSTINSVYCKNNKLMIDENLVDKYIQILVDQLCNKIYQDDFANIIYKKNIINEYAFNKESFEIITYSK